MGRKRQKILFLYLNTGGGHFRAAKAVADYIKKYHLNEAKISLVEGLEDSGGFVKYFVEDGYRLAQDNFLANCFYRLLYALNIVPIFAKTSSRLFSRFAGRRLTALVIREKPDKIVIFHFLLVEPVLRALKAAFPAPPVFVIVTDPFSPHPIWFANKNKQIRYIVFSETLARKHSLVGAKVCSFILSEKFSRPPHKHQVQRIREKIGLSQGRKVVLLLGGGDGLPKQAKILKALLAAGIDADFLVVCGRNRKLKNRAEKIKKEYKAENVRIFGFVDFVYDLIAASDLVITKAGPAAIFEILILGKIPIITSYIWGQEKGNRDFVVGEGLGFYESRIKRLPLLVKRLLFQEKLVKQLQERISKISLRNGLEETAEFILGLGAGERS